MYLPTTKGLGIANLSIICRVLMWNTVLFRFYCKDNNYNRNKERLSLKSPVFSRTPCFPFHAIPLSVRAHHLRRRCYLCVWQAPRMASVSIREFRGTINHPPVLSAVGAWFYSHRSHRFAQILPSVALSSPVITSSRSAGLRRVFFEHESHESYECIFYETPTVFPFSCHS